MRGTSRSSAALAALLVIAAAAGADQHGRRAGRLLIDLDLQQQACAWRASRAAPAARAEARRRRHCWRSPRPPAPTSAVGAPAGNSSTWIAAGLRLARAAR
ncbi:hypothetical protein, partial [Burkholderia gladioli]|uniref:hypothetical protein n=1 Tax=Burkholderia gladioli TaxID=28095 RepID=UPI002655A20E